MSLTSVIITAGGIGSRMNAEVPKQFLEINGTPVLMHTISRFHYALRDIEIIVTLPSDWVQYWEKLCVQYNFSIPHLVISGGKERYHSIKNALKNCHGDTVMIHDGVRPCISYSFLQKCLSASETMDAVIPVLRVSESMRQLSKGRSIAVDRNDFLLVQTPQVFKKEILTNAYQIAFSAEIMDDASLVEKAGYGISTIPGISENIKITTPRDLVIAAEYLK